MPVFQRAEVSGLPRSRIAAAQHGLIRSNKTEREKGLPPLADWVPIARRRLRSTVSIPGHRSVVMFGMLVIVFRRHNIARPGFLLGKREISLVVSKRACGTVHLGAVGIRCPPL